MAVAVASKIKLTAHSSILPQLNSVALFYIIYPIYHPTRVCFNTFDHNRKIEDDYIAVAGCIVVMNLNHIK